MYFSTLLSLSSNTYISLFGSSQGFQQLLFLRFFPPVKITSVLPHFSLPPPLSPSPSLSLPLSLPPPSLSPLSPLSLSPSHPLLLSLPHPPPLSPSHLSHLFPSPFSLTFPPFPICLSFFLSFFFILLTLLSSDCPLIRQFISLFYSTGLFTGSRFQFWATTHGNFQWRRNEKRI